MIPEDEKQCEKFKISREPVAGSSSAVSVSTCCFCCDSRFFEGQVLHKTEGRTEIYQLLRRDQTIFFDKRLSLNRLQRFRRGG